MSTRNKRTDKQMEDDKNFIAKQLLMSKTTRETLRLLNEENERKNKGYTLSLAMIVYDYKKVLNEWRDERKEYIDLIVDRELKKLDVIEAECWQAWEKSKEGKKITKLAGGTLSGGQVQGGSIKERSMEETNGDTKYLDKVFDCMDRRKELLGYGAAKKIEFSGSVGVGVSPMQEDDIAKERKRILNTLHKVG